MAMTMHMDVTPRTMGDLSLASSSGESCGDSMLTF